MLYEAAEIDGAGRMRKFLNITIPMLTPTIFFSLVMGLTFLARVDVVFVLLPISLAWLVRLGRSPVRIAALDRSAPASGSG